MHVQVGTQEFAEGRGEVVVFQADRQLGRLGDNGKLAFDHDGHSAKAVLYVDPRLARRELDLTARGAVEVMNFTRELRAVVKLVAVHPRTPWRVPPGIAAEDRHARRS